MTHHDRIFEWVVAVTIGVAAGALLLLERHLLEIVLAAVSPENDIYDSRDFLVHFPSLFHIGIAMLIPLVIAAICNWRRVSNERTMSWLFFYFVIVVLTCSAVGVVGVRMYRGMTAVG